MNAPAPWLAFPTAIFANVYYWLCAAAGRRFSRQRPPPEPETFPPATIIIPLKGESEDLGEHLRRFGELDYPEYQALFAVASADDPACVVARAAAAAAPGRAEVVIASPAIGANPKENNHAAAYARAKHPWIVLTDGDVAPESDYLKRVLAPLHDPDIALVTCLYRFIGRGGFWARLKAANIHASFLPSVMLAWALAPVRFGIGATLAFRRADLDAIGGFPAIADFLASDFWLAQKLAARGRVLLLPYWLDIRLDDCDLKRYIDYQLRWTRTMRRSAPAGYAGLIATQGLLWAGLFCALTGGSRLGWTVLAATLFSRALSAFALGRMFRAPTPLALLFLHDLLAPFFWILGWTGRKVRWAGSVYALGAGTKIIASTQRRTP